MIGQRLPPVERLAQAFVDVAPQFYQGAVGVTTSIVELFACVVTVLVVGFYWTMEVPKIERLVLSLLAVERRARVLAAWHEIEAKLGGFMRGQALAMLTVGAASAIGYALIGLPHVPALAVLSGILEAVPWIGPVLGFVPAAIVALPIGSHTLLLVVGFAVMLQLVENNVLITSALEAHGFTVSGAPVGALRPSPTSSWSAPRRQRARTDDQRPCTLLRYRSRIHGHKTDSRRLWNPGPQRSTS